MEEQWNEPDIHCFYLANIAYEIHKFQRGFTGKAPDPFKDYILEFKNRLDDMDRIEREDSDPEQKAKSLKDAEISRMEASKMKWRISTGAKSKAMQDHLSKVKVKPGRTKRNPPKK